MGNDRIKKLFEIFYAALRKVSLHSKGGRGEKANVSQDMNEMLEKGVGMVLRGLEGYLDNPEVSCIQKLEVFKKKESSLDILGAVAEENYDVADLIGIDEFDLRNLYEIASKQLATNFEMARDLFAFLIFLDFARYQFWIGVACALSELGAHEDAIQAYGIAILISEHHPLSYVYFARYLLMQNDPLAKEVIEEGLDLASQSDEFEQELAMLEHLKNQAA